MNVLAGLELQGTEVVPNEASQYLQKREILTFKAQQVSAGSRQQVCSDLNSTQSQQCCSGAQTSAPLDAVRGALLEEQAGNQQHPCQPPALLYNPSLSTSSQIEEIAGHVLACIQRGILPTIPFAPEVTAAALQSSSQLVEASQSYPAVSIAQTDRASTQTQSQVEIQASQGTQESTAKQSKSRGIAADSKNAKATDRFNRALVLLDTIHVRTSLPCCVPMEALLVLEHVGSIRGCWTSVRCLQEKKLECASQTQRDLYYNVKGSLFPTPVQVANCAPLPSHCVFERATHLRKAWQLCANSMLHCNSRLCATERRPKERWLLYACSQAGQTTDTGTPWDDALQWPQRDRSLV